MFIKVKDAYGCRYLVNPAHIVTVAVGDHRLVLTLVSGQLLDTKMSLEEFYAKTAVTTTTIGVLNG